MKAILADASTRVLCLRLVPGTGSAVRLTDHPRDLTLGAETYRSTVGHQLSGYSAPQGFAPAAIDLAGILSASGIPRALLSARRFDGARVYIFATSWAAPVEDEEQIFAGLLGKSELFDDSYRIDGLSLIDALSQSVIAVYQEQCPKPFLGQEFAGCRVPVAANTVTGTLTHVTSTTVFRDSARAESADVFGCGTLAFTTGANAGAKPIEIREHLADGTVTLFEPLYSLPSVGDAYTATRGCRKRIIDCQNRWNGTATYSNILNFGGDLWVPTASVYGQRGTR